MSIVVRPATAADRSSWDAFLAGRSEADPLQSWAWAEAGKAVGERWERRLAADDRGRLRGLMLVNIRSTSLGRTIHYAPHGPIWDRDAADSATVLAALLQEGRRLARSTRGIVLKVDPRTRDRGSTPDPGDAASDHGDATAVTARLGELGLRPSGLYLQAPTTRIVDLLDGGESLLSTWVPDARTRVRRAAKEGIVTEVDREGAPAALDAFHGLLVETSERAGIRIRSRAFLAALAEGHKGTDDWFMALARFEGRPVAGICGPRVGDRAFYLYAASARDPSMERKRTGYAAMAALMRALAEAGTRTLDLWGVREAGDASVDASWEGFSSFKTRFGGRPLRHPGTFDLVIDPFWSRVRDWRTRLMELAGRAVTESSDTI